MFYSERYKFYKQFSEDQYYPEFAKLISLRDRHLEQIKEKYEQQSMFGQNARREREERKIEDLYKQFYDWVEESVEIKNEPYTRIIAVFQGVKA